MKIKWKFEEENKSTDEYGNLKSYYKNSEPWKKPRPGQNIFIQILEIILALVICGVIVIVAANFKGYDWNQSGFRFIRDVLTQNLGLNK